MQLLKTRFIPVAIDQAYQRRQQDAEGEFYQKIANQGPRKIGSGTTQGLYAASADGTLLGYTNNRGPKRTMQLMTSALAKHRPVKVEVIKPGKPDPKFNPEPPQGGFVVRVTAKVLGGYPPTEDSWQRIYQQSIGRDNLWVRGDENKALLAGQFPKSLLSRIVRYHLVDNTRGEPPTWDRAEIRRIDSHFKNGKLLAKIHLETKDGTRAYRAELMGFVVCEDGRVTRFDLVASGQFRGHGRYTGNAPKGQFPLAVAFKLADGSDVADRIPPQGSRGWVAGYLK